jgi:poly-gamma-glutamate synthesis protein (capsule biosynthesis protein)
LKDSGVDLVELTGNHNNDFGAQYNKETIELYESLGWGTVGGGLNNEDARKAFLTDDKGTKLAFLAYNYPDSPNGLAISGIESAGANSFDFAKIEADILAAKQEADFVTVNVQYWECYAYPDGYVEFPECDLPIGEQEANFKRIVDLGADMVVGSSAHQPQTYEMYNGKPIYYGLGNLYFDQTSWPGTERGLVLSNYFVDGKLIQTKITPTVYGDDLQTRIMTDEETEFLLTRLKDAR